MSNAPFERDRSMDKPGIVGARWWHASLADQGAQLARRDAIRNILIAGGVIAGFGALLAMCLKSGSSSSSYSSSSSSTAAPLDPDEYQERRRTSLDVQKDYGWSFGANAEPLVFDGAVRKPFDASSLATLTTDLKPARTDLARFYLSTLFDSPYATPKLMASLPDEERTGWKMLVDVMKPIFTPSMDGAYRRGKAFASLFAALPEPTAANAALVVDMTGPLSVAFAAGAVSAFDPVFLFDNWPHPRGVVRSQETLSAAAYYQPLFAKARLDTKPELKAPLFVLDRRRLAPYTDDATQFDNRYVAKLPAGASRMKSIGGARVLYVVERAADTAQELDDLNEDFLAYSGAGVDVKAMGIDVFTEELTASDGGVDAGPKVNQLVTDSGGLYYGGSRASHFAFFADYPWVKPPRPATMRPAKAPGADYRPLARRTPYSTGAPRADQKTSPPSFATVPVVLAVGTGVLLGARYSRSGSWNRSTGGGWSG